jgi:hypothetical protein
VTTETEQKIATLKQELRELEAQAKAEREERARKVRPEFNFTLVPTEDPWDKIYDPSCRLYSLVGTVMNMKELREVGKGFVTGGSMNYLWNGATNRFVCAVGGGSIYAKDPATWEMLSQFIVEVPDGGDVTAIVNSEVLK